MKRILIVSVWAVVALVCATAVKAVTPQSQELYCKRVFCDAFFIDKQLPEGIIGIYNAYDIDWPKGIGRFSVPQVQNAVGHFVFGDKYKDGENINQVVVRELDGENSLPVPNDIHEAFFKSVDFSWLFTSGMDNFYFNLTRVKHLEADGCSWEVFRKVYTGWMGATSHEYQYFMIYDMNKSKVLTTADIFVKSNEKVVVDAIVSKMMENTGAKNLAELRDKLCFLDGVKVPPMPKNIGYESGKFIFVYNPYEISCGSAETIIVKVDVANLRDALTKEAQETLRRFLF